MPKTKYLIKVDGREPFLSRAATRAQAERSARLIKQNNGALEVEVIEVR